MVACEDMILVLGNLFLFFGTYLCNFYNFYFALWNLVKFKKYS